MKVWYGFSSEHSMNLVMIGRFKDAATAETVNAIIDRLKTAVEADEEAGRLEVGEPTDSFSDEMLRLLSDVNVYNVEPREFEQFLYDVDVRRDGDYGKMIVRAERLQDVNRAGFGQSKALGRRRS